MLPTLDQDLDLCLDLDLLGLGLIFFSSVAAAAPCDIYASGGTPCVAAHSTTRALYNAYTGSLYQVKRASDNATTNISPYSAGGVANIAIQDTFCTGTTCSITIIYDQSGHKNHLTQAPPGAFLGPAPGGYDNLASATGAPVLLNDKTVYGVFIAPGTGYRNNAAIGTATGDEPEGMYAVLDGTHYNGGCCFDYGNAETSTHDTGNGHMEAIYFGNHTIKGTGAGDGPWIMADLENGLFSGDNKTSHAKESGIDHRFITAIVKGEPNHWAIRGGNAASGTLSTFYDGSRPSESGYNPMSKEGAIVLGIGGDNSHWAQGTFYEGAMTAGYPSEATENLVQANIVAMKYRTSAPASRAALVLGTAISMQPAKLAHRRLVHRGTTVSTQLVSASTGTQTLKTQASWMVRAGLGNKGCYSFESIALTGHYLVHDENFKLEVKPIDGTRQFSEDATFCTEIGLNGDGFSIRSWNHPTRYLRQHNNVVYIASNGDGIHDFDTTTSFHDEASWIIGSSLV